MIYVTGDLFHHQLELAEPQRNVRWAERETLQASQAAFMAWAAADGGLVYFAHIPGAYRVEQGEIQAGASGVSFSQAVQIL